MKIRSTVVLLVALALSARAGVPTMVTVPWSVSATNLTDYSRTNAPTWWNGGTNFLGIPPGVDYSLGVPSWMAWQAANYNFGVLAGFLNTNLVNVYGDATGTGAVAIPLTVNNVRGTLTNNISGGAAWATNTPTGQPVASLMDVTSATNSLLTIANAKFLTTNSLLDATKVVGTVASAGWASNTPDGSAIVRLLGTNTWTGSNNFGAGKLLVDGAVVLAGGTGGSNGGPYVFAVSPSRWPENDDGDAKITGAGFLSSGSIALSGTSVAHTFVSPSEIDVSWAAFDFADGVYDVTYSGPNGNFTLLGGFTIGPAFLGGTNAFISGDLEVAGNLDVLGKVSATPCTIGSATATTGGQGAGIICFDSDYIYVSVGVNSWKRAPLSTW